MSQYGLACDNLVSADVVTAEGEVITASATAPGPLLGFTRWGNFGVVTSFEYQLHPDGTVAGRQSSIPVTQARDFALPSRLSEACWIAPPPLRGS